MDLKAKILDLLEHVPWSFKHGRHLYAEELSDRISMMCQELMTEAVAYWVSEADYYREQVEDGRSRTGVDAEQE
jgi:hypothetical protein